LEKHQVRRYFSGQLESLWKTHPALRWFDNSGDIQRGHAKKFERQGVEFVPLVVEEFELICELDIEFLRPGRSGMVISDGGEWVCVQDSNGSQWDVHPSDLRRMQSADPGVQLVQPN
jgi:hypothetical protein